MRGWPRMAISLRGDSPQGTGLVGGASQQGHSQHSELIGWEVENVKRREYTNAFVAQESPFCSPFLEGLNQQEGAESVILYWDILGDPRNQIPSSSRGISG